MNWRSNGGTLISNLITSICIIVMFLSYTQVNGQTSRCKFQEFRCVDGSGCLLTEKLCNGIPDCNSAEDENWDCSRIHLSSDCGDQHKYFKCRFGGCLARRLVCDGVVHCLGGSDEASDLCGNSGLKPVPSIIPPGGDNGNPNSRPMPKPKPPPQVKPRPNPLPPTTLRPRITTPEYPVEEPVRPSAVADPVTRRPRPPSTAPGTTVGHSCPSLQEEEGIRIKCSPPAVNCIGPVPDGTVAKSDCKKHYNPPLNSPISAKQICQNGQWTSRNRIWNCIPNCGKGGGQQAQFIMGGTTSSIGKWPWHVGFYHRDPPNSENWVYFCGGTLISSRAVLTAAHCVTDTKGQVKDDIRLFFGKYFRNIAQSDENVEERLPVKIKVNEFYDPHTYASDIATVTVDTLVLSDRIQPVCLPNDDGLQGNDIGTLVGWGKYADKSYPNELQEAQLPVHNAKYCRSTHPTLEALVKSNTFCAGYKNGTSPCDGDSGGGFVYLDHNRYSIYGVVSAGVARRGGGCDPRFYTVFMNVVKFRDFIDETLNQDSRLKRSPQKYIQT